MSSPAVSSAIRIWRACRMWHLAASFGGFERAGVIHVVSTSISHEAYSLVRTQYPDGEASGS